MGSYSNFIVRGWSVLSCYGAVEPVVATVFTEQDRGLFSTSYEPNGHVTFSSPSSSGRSRRSRGVAAYSAPAEIIARRLDLMGFTLDRTARRFEAAFNKGRRTNKLSGVPFADWQGEAARILGRNDFYQMPLRRARGYPLFRRAQRVMDSIGEVFPFPAGDLHYFVRAIVSICSGSEPVFLDFDELVGGGYCKRDASLKDLAALHMNNDLVQRPTTIVLTEGSTDVQILKPALSLRMPLLSTYFSFPDFDLKPQGGAGQLALLVKALAASGISNRVIALFDNDTAGSAAISTLDLGALPANMRVLQLPAIDFLRSYPTEGAQGQHLADANGSAGSLELYLGKDLLVRPDGTLTPVEWGGQDRKLGRYQGEVKNKAGLQKAYLELVRRADPAELSRHDWSGMDAILESVIHAFD